MTCGKNWRLSVETVWCTTSPAMSWRRPQHRFLKCKNWFCYCITIICRHSPTHPFQRALMKSLAMNDCRTVQIFVRFRGGLAINPSSSEMVPADGLMAMSLVGAAWWSRCLSFGRQWWHVNSEERLLLSQTFNLCLSSTTSNLQRGAKEMFSHFSATANIFLSPLNSRPRVDDPLNPNDMNSIIGVWSKWRIIITISKLLLRNECLFISAPIAAFCKLAMNIFT